LVVAELLADAGVVPVGGDVVDEQVRPDVEDEQVRLAVVPARRGDQAPGQVLGALEVGLDDDIAVVVAGDGLHGVGQVRERGDQAGPQRLADGADLAVAAQHPLLAPDLDRHVGEAGVHRAQIGHGLDVVRPVPVEELGHDRGRGLGGTGTLGGFGHVRAPISS
jgi:hypothetical protein